MGFDTLARLREKRKCYVILYFDVEREVFIGIFLYFCFASSCCGDIKTTRRYSSD